MNKYKMNVIHNDIYHLNDMLAESLIKEITKKIYKITYEKSNISLKDTCSNLYEDSK